MASETTISEWVNDIHEGDAAEVLAELPESSVHMAMTSPPYFGLRDYGVDGQIGLEDSLGEYIDDLLDVAEQLRRVLRPDGSWWLNLGDSFAGSWGAQSKDETSNNIPQHGFPEKNPARNGRFRRKSKMLVPHRVAIALQDSGWIVRSDAVWSKPNPMPHPVSDRLHEHKEYVFHLVPEPDYWFDLDAIRAPHKEKSIKRAKRDDFRGTVDAHPGDIYPDRPDGSKPHNFNRAVHPNGKNPGDILEVPVKAFPDAHFAVYPIELCQLPIKSSCPPKVCIECGTPYTRDVEEVPVWERDPETIEREQLQRAIERYQESNLTVDHLEAVRAKGFSDAAAGKQQTGAGRNTDDVEQLAEEAKDVLGGYFREFTMTASSVGGWEQDCDCETDETEPGIVLDPFAGAGTTCVAAKELGRRFLGVDLNPDYVAMAQKRVGVDVDEPERLLDDGETNLTAFVDSSDAS